MLFQINGIYCIHCVTDVFLLLAGSDFSGVNQAFQLSSTKLTYNFNITIVNDDTVEVPEYFFVNLTHVTHECSVKIIPKMATVNIVDDDDGK